MFLPTLIQGCEKNLFVEEVFVFPQGQPKPPASLAEEEKREEAFVSCNAQAVARQSIALPGRIQAGSENHILRLKCGCILS